MLTKLKKWLSDAKRDKTIFDVVLYGSAAKGKELPNDLDILVLFREGSLKERLNKIQILKKKVRYNGKVDIKGILWEDLFKEEFFARSGIFLEGISILDGKPFSQKIDYNGFSLFVYNLKKKTHTEKVKFNYVLSGRNTKGIIEMLEGKHLAPGVVQVPIKNALEFEDVLKKNEVTFEKKNILIQQ
tara:strand:- start:70 stop:627 length:558 start_codon:yes stop_codon:yes gene_type:complete